MLKIESTKLEEKMKQYHERDCKCAECNPPPKEKETIVIREEIKDRWHNYDCFYIQKSRFEKYSKLFLGNAISEHETKRMMLLYTRT